MTLDMTQHQAVDEAGADSGSSRRALLRAAGVGGAVAAVGLTAAACGSSSNDNASSGNPPASSAPAGGSPSASAGSGGSGGGGVLAQTSDVPVDGGKIVTADGGTVITQPAAGTYKAFSAICTHQGCTVAQVADNKITCPCHGSQYSAMDGTVLQGPATQPLAAKKISVSGGQITLAS